MDVSRGPSCGRTRLRCEAAGLCEDAQVQLKWVDTHVHLGRYSATEASALLDTAMAAGVGMLSVAGLDEDCGQTPGAGVLGRITGVHPLQAATGCHGLEAALAGAGVVAVGECGFDAAGPPWDLQRAVFHDHCRAARERGLPLVLHIDGEGAWEAFKAASDACEGLRLVRHYFTGDEQQAAWHAWHGDHLSFGNPLRRTSALRDIARTYPADLLLIETDSYPLGSRNTQPRDVATVGETLALLRGWTFAEASAHLLDNTARAFSLDLAQAGEISR